MVYTVSIGSLWCPNMPLSDQGGLYFWTNSSGAVVENILYYLGYHRINSYAIKFITGTNIFLTKILKISASQTLPF